MRRASLSLLAGLACGALACGEGDAPAPGPPPPSTGFSGPRREFVPDTQVVLGDSLRPGDMIVTHGRPIAREVHPRAGARDPDQPGAVRAIDPATALERMRRADPPWYVLDVRGEEAFATQGRVPGALLAPLDRLEENVEDLHVRVDQVLLIVAEDGARGRAAARLLASYGFPDVRVLEGGFAAWRAAGLPLEGAP